MKNLYLTLFAVISITCSSTAQVNSNTTKIFIDNKNAKNWALSSGANNITENGFHIYNWTDNPTNPLLSIQNDGSTSISNAAGSTLTLQKSSSHIPALTFQGAASYSIIEAGDDYMTAYVGGDRRLTILSNGNVGIGTINPNGYKLAVQGKIHAQEVMVDISSWPDFVFNEDYALKPLSEVKSFIAQNKHLPDIPSAKEMTEKGLNLGEMNRLLTKKIEELTLYMLQKEEEIKNQQLINEKQIQINLQQQQQINALITATDSLIKKLRK